MNCRKGKKSIEGRFSPCGARNRRSVQYFRQAASSPFYSQKCGFVKGKRPRQEESAGAEGENWKKLIGEIEANFGLEMTGQTKRFNRDYYSIPIKPHQNPQNLSPTASGLFAR